MCITPEMHQSRFWGAILQKQRDATSPKKKIKRERAREQKTLAKGCDFKRDCKCV